jgi:hypothetical protein
MPPIQEIDMFAIIARMFRLTLLLAGAFAILQAGPAQASFHTYGVAQIYSNADGTVQYVELVERFGAGGQNFLQGHRLVSGGNTFNIATNLPSSNTAGTHVLFATQAFANLGVVTPDYIIPANFLSTTGGSVNYAESTDIMAYASLPTNGNAVARDGSTTTPTPTNFAGKSGSLAASCIGAACVIPQAGFWYNQAEGGRGYVIEIHGNTLFIGGFMYDNNGNAIWYASGPAPMVNSTTYTNVWQQYGGGQSLTGTYKPSTVVNANVGALTIQFTSATTATLTLPNQVQIPIVRFPF